MDYQNRAGSKFGGGGIAGSSETNADRRERLRKLALETIDLSKDPYFMKNHLGTYECKLCLTIHANDGSYLAHTQGKKHQTNLARRAAFERGKSGTEPFAAKLGQVDLPQVAVRRNVVKIGRPGYKIMKVQDPITRQFGIFIQIQFPEIKREIRPRYRFMSAFEQHVEPADRKYQYLIVAAEPYETIGIKIDAGDIDHHSGRIYDYWDAPNYYIQFFFIGRPFSTNSD